MEGFLPATIKSHVVKIVITWSISPDENNNIGLVNTKVSSICIGDVQSPSHAVKPGSRTDPSRSTIILQKTEHSHHDVYYAHKNHNAY